MSKKIILGLVGKIASGKGTVTTFLENKYNASTYRFSDIMRDILVRLHLPINRSNMQLISTLIRQNFSEDIFSKIVARNVIKDNNKIIVIDGIRRMSDIKYLAKNKNFKLIKIDASSEARYERLLKRNENLGDKKKTYKDFLADQEKEADAEIPKVMEKAKIILDNNGTFKDLYSKIIEIIKS